MPFGTAKRLKGVMASAVTSKTRNRAANASRSISGRSRYCAATCKDFSRYVSPFGSMTCNRRAPLADHPFVMMTRP